jgi:hypothetical protein
MMTASPIRQGTRRRAARPSEQGYVLLIAIFLMALLVISLSVAMPSVIKSIQRDRELETFHRGLQYRRAIQLYYRKFHAYPPNADALVKTQEIRFLRKRYIDPMTGKNDWKPILFGQNKVPTAMGFFGQPLSGTGSTLAGTGPSGGSGLTGTSSGTSSFGSSTFGSSTFGSSTTSTATTTTATDSGSATSSGSDSATGSSTSSGSTSSTSSTSTSAFGSSSSSSSSGLTGQTFGGAGIIGFAPASARQSILVYKKKNHFNEWEFTYDPISDMQTVSNNKGTAGQSSSSLSSSTGSSSSSSSGSSSGSSGSSSTSTTP